VTGVIRTIGGDLPAGLAGPTYVHEHLVIDSQLVADTMPHIHLYSVEEARAEVQTCVAAGVRTMVDAMPAGAGRDPERLSRISVLTGMRVVAATGLHTDRYYEDVEWAETESAERLAERFIADVVEGIDLHDYRGEEVERSAARAGLVKVATMTSELSGRDQRLFEAAARTASMTGVPVLTHTEGGHGGLAQIEALTGLGVSPDRIALSHTDKVADKGYHRAMLETGALLCYDQGLRAPERTLGLIGDMIEADFGSQIIVGTDGARRSLWSTLGGSPGLASLYHLVQERFDDPIGAQILVSNPARYLALRPEG
jgi:5-phospho-D-xylono-1,4-lactonase